MSAGHDQLVDELFARTLAAQRAWVRGDPSAYVELFSADQLTIFGPFGGPAIIGRDAVGAGRVASMFSGGTADIELVDAIAADDIVCLVMVERCEVTFGDAEHPQPWILRTTQVYRRQDDGWKVVHRHAEPLIQRRDLQQTLALLDPRT